MTDGYFTVPIFRKKKPPPSYAPANSFRLFLEDPCDVEKVYPPVSHPPPTTTNVIGQPLVGEPPCHSFACYRPSPLSSRVLAGGSRNMMKPVCDVRTKGIDPDGGRWWLHKAARAVEPSPPRDDNTTMRSDFRYRGEGTKGKTRYSANPHKTLAYGTVPVTQLRPRNGHQRFMKEDISFETQYNCRKDPNFPQRGKRHGSLVWTEVPDGLVDHMLCRSGYADSQVAPKDVTCEYMCPPPPPCLDWHPSKGPTCPEVLPPLTGCPRHQHSAGAVNICAVVPSAS